MKRKIIDIDEEKCTGCGRCIPDCPEGALQLIEGKARLVSDLFCDGLGACMGTCPEGAITVVEREAGAYDEKAVMANVVPKGPAVITAHLEHLLGHGERDLYNQAIEYLEEHYVPIPAHETAGDHPGHGLPGHHSFAGCPGSTARSIPRTRRPGARPQPGITASELRQWPVQLKLLNPRAGYFDNADLLIAADCVPVALADFHRDFLKDKIVIIFCPKLDTDIDGYITKMAEILTLHTINSITVLHMEVPCCSGVTNIINQALERSEKKVPVKEFSITIDGQVQ
jgi:NAD-dependent dihydropyrimidine dehydrogenase PreA subunit